MAAVVMATRCLYRSGAGRSAEVRPRCPVMLFVRVNHSGIGKRKKKTARFLPPPQKKDTGHPSLRLEFSRHKSPLSLVFLRFLHLTSFGRRPTQSVLRRRKKKKKKKKAFVVVVVYVVLFDSSREEGRAREREFFLCRACAGGFKFKTPGNQKTISGNSHFSLAIISIERFGRVGTRSVRRETAVFFVCAL